MQSTLQLSAMDVSARTTMKDAVKCDNHSELQNSENQQIFERIMCFFGNSGKHTYFRVSAYPYSIDCHRSLANEIIDKSSVWLPSSSLVI